MYFAKSLVSIIFPVKFLAQFSATVVFYGDKYTVD